ncbi:hypothetical protein P152DRAFT_379133, partial [Eremomyces bilateralis CBS 781.70]
FEVFTSLRYDPALLTCEENGHKDVSFGTPTPFYMIRLHRDRMFEAVLHFEFGAAVGLLADGERLEETLLKEVKRWQRNENATDGALKIRILFSKLGSMKVEISPVPPVPRWMLYPTTLNLTAQSKDMTRPTIPFTPSPRTGGALTLGSDDSLPNPTTTTSSGIPSPTWDLHLDSAPIPTSPFTTLKTTHRTFYNEARSRSLPDPSKQIDGAPSAIVNHEVLLYDAQGIIIEGSTTTPYFWRDGRWVTPDVGNAGEPVGKGGQRGTTRRWALMKGLCEEKHVTQDSVKVGDEVWVSNGVRGFGLGRVV